MQNRVYIKSYEAVCVAGFGMDEIFENLLDKRVLFSGGNEVAAIGIIGDLNDARKFCMDAVGSSTKTYEANSSADALMEAIAAVKNGELGEAAVFAHFLVGDDVLGKLRNEAPYSCTVAKPFDFESDGFNAGEAVVAIVLSAEGGVAEILDFAVDREQSNAVKAACKEHKIEYVEAAARGVPSEDRQEAAILSEMFGQEPIVASHKGFTGYTGGASTLLNIAITLKILEEGIIPASSMLEHSFTNEISFAYANRFKKLKTALSNSFENGYYASFVVQKS